MTAKPPYYERVRQKAAERWDQLERDPELAGPWHQLFQQVQSPRHVLSELLQNADDAGAHEASVRIEDGAFVFEHDGEDFTEEHFASLCRFAFSNKRSLHTIGFRGIGFKSTFSLGDRVEVHTPTLSIYFDQNRFTEPVWLDRALRSDGKTCVRVVIQDEHRRREVERNLQEWQNSPVSLLFLRNIRRLRVGDAYVQWRSLGPGPVPNSEWMASGNDSDRAVLLIRSEEEPFPEEALAEIRRERMLLTGEDVDFPPSRVEIVLGVEGRLFVVLPTDIRTALPFACNAPFIQDPARVTIKAPETSPTNRWLLERAGRLAASALLTWLARTDLSPAERAQAYGLFPDVDRGDSSVGGACATIVEETFEACIEGRDFVLTEEGSLAASKQCLAVPPEVLEVWSPRQAAALLDEDKRPILSRHVTAEHREKLVNWGVIDDLKRQHVLGALKNRRPARPTTWDGLLKLWAYVAPAVLETWPRIPPEGLHIVPVQGKKELYAAQEVVRLAEKKVLRSDDDWKFLGAHLLVLDREWLGHLATRKRAADREGRDLDSDEELKRAYDVLERIGLDKATDVSTLVDIAAKRLFTQDTVPLAHAVRLAQIAAQLGAKAGDRFHYYVRGGSLRSLQDQVLFDEDGGLEELLPEAWRPSRLLHDAYTRTFTSCTREEWHTWVANGRAGLFTFPPLMRRWHFVDSRAAIRAELERRGAHREPSFYYDTDTFEIEDWDWDYTGDLWQHWTALAASDERVWSEVAERILAQGQRYWGESTQARALQVSRNGRSRFITDEPLLPAWLLRLQGVPCLRDTQGFRRRPAELLRRTPETEPFRDIEPFVHSALDNEGTRPILDLLGVGTVPASPEGLLRRLRALARAGQAPVHEVERWYHRLDQLVDACSTSDLEEIRRAFRHEPLILTNHGAWTTTSDVFIEPDDENVPGVALLRDSVRHLALWHKLGVAERPTVDLIIRWLRELPSGERVPRATLQPVRAVLKRHPARIWEECRHWLNLADEWVPIEQLSYALTPQSGLSGRDLHGWVKQQTANLEDLSPDIVQSLPFRTLHALASLVEERLSDAPRLLGKRERRPWLLTFGQELSRVRLESRPKPSSSGRWRSA